MWYRKARQMMNKDITGFERIAAAGMGRLLQHMTSGPYAILSADRVGMTPDQRDAARMRLKNTLRGMGYGWVDTRGAWRQKGEDKYARENSVFVPGMSPDDASRIGLDFDQDEVIVGDDGTFSFLDLKPEDGEAAPADVERLEDHLVIPELSLSPDIFTEIGNRKFELQFPDPEKRAIPGGRFSPEGIARVREQLDRIGRPRPEVHENAFVAHAYAGPPPHWMIPVSGMRFAGSKSECKGQTGGLPLTSFDRMAYFIPFVARVAEVLPEFHPSPHWGRPVQLKTAAVAKAPPQSGFQPEDYERVLEGLARFRGGPADLFSTQNPGGNNMMGFDSLYLGPSGDFFLLQPHTHDETSRSVLRGVDPTLPAKKCDSPRAPSGKRKPMKAGGYTHTDLTKASGIQRVQIYRDGMGVTIEMSNPPTSRQLDAIRKAYSMTSRNRFVAEITYDGVLVGHLQSFAELVHFVNNFDPENPTSTPEMDPRAAEMAERFLFRD